MNDFGLVFALVVAAPAAILALVAATRHEQAAFAHRMLVVYAALLVVAFASLTAEALNNPIVLYLGLVAACVAILSSGPVSLAVSAFFHFVFLIFSLPVALPFSLAGPAIALAACLFTLVWSLSRGTSAGR